MTVWNTGEQVEKGKDLGEMEDEIEQRAGQDRAA